MKKQKAVPMTDSELDALMTTPRVQNLIEAAVSKSHNMYVLHSILQKANRRDFEHDALEAAWELDMVAGDRQTKSRAGGMWSILRRCCSEDVSLANSGLVLEIEGLWRFWEKQTESANNRHEPWRLFTWDAVLRICRSPKCRIVDHIAQVIPHGKLAKIVKEFRETKKSRMAVPHYARDGIHDGGMRGGILADFLINEDAALTPKADGIDDPYKAEIDAALASVNPKPPIPDAPKPTKKSKAEKDAFAEEWLRNHLKDGPQPLSPLTTPTGYLWHYIPKGIGLARLKSAAKRMGVQELKSGPRGGLHWHLPEHPDMKPDASKFRLEDHAPYPAATQPFPERIARGAATKLPEPAKPKAVPGAVT